MCEMNRRSLQADEAQTATQLRPHTVKRAGTRRMLNFLNRNMRLVRLLRNWPDAIAAGWSGSPLERAHLRSGIRLDGPPESHLDFLFDEIFVTRTYSPRGYEIRSDFVVVDIGANIGTFSLYAATAAPRVRVIAYEPSPDNCKWLRRNVANSRLSNVTVCEQAVAGAPGARVLRADPANWMVHRLETTGDLHAGLTVECVTLEEVLRVHNIDRCDLLKLDCEGSEYEILRSCQSHTMRRVARIVGEYHDTGNGNDGQELCDILKSLGFVVEHFSPLEKGGTFCAKNLALTG